eukprot:CAMPEP_0204843810 /NCGR_PEP_ID=MMETSP1346-20131115/48200_1 /ASSEMBLY_ACC=CAM_ASM_000771 /TAXON_ID=215587 /ORGANISM="Aplanochytrium stocchinoi, Strain GSBS06" /LENGTH=299 /DNA_ID=CAMNT_0051983021 /DNA_START=105 /DNA_END=1004 /DNA_ORIENTATION=+
MPGQVLNLTVGSSSRLSVRNLSNLPKRNEGVSWLFREVKIWVGLGIFGLTAFGIYKYGYYERIPSHVSALVLEAVKAKHDGEFRKAETLLIRAKNVIDTSPFSENSKFKIYMLLANCYYDAGDNLKAENGYSEAVELLKNKSKDISQSVLNTPKFEPNRDAFVAYSRLAEFAHNRQDYNKAETFYLKSLSALIQPSRLSQIYTLWKTENVESYNGNLDESEIVRERHPEIVKELLLYGKDLAGVLNNLALLYLERNDVEESKAILERCFAVMTFSGLQDLNIEWAENIDGFELAPKAWS